MYNVHKQKWALLQIILLKSDYRKWPGSFLTSTQFKMMRHSLRLCRKTALVSWGIVSNLGSRPGTEQHPRPHSSGGGKWQELTGGMTCSLLQAAGPFPTAHRPQKMRSPGWLLASSDTESAFWQNWTLKHVSNCQPYGWWRNWALLYSCVCVWDQTSMIKMNLFWSPFFFPGGVAVTQVAGLWLQRYKGCFCEAQRATRPWATSGPPEHRIFGLLS